MTLKLKGKLLTLIVPSAPPVPTQWQKMLFALSVTEIFSPVYDFLANTAMVCGILHTVSSQNCANNKKESIIFLARLLHFSPRQRSLLK